MNSPESQLDLSLAGNLPSLIAAVDQWERSPHLFETTARIHFLRNFSIEQIEPFLKLHLYRMDIQPQIFLGEYNAIEQEILDRESHIHKHTPDLIVLSLVLELFWPSQSMPGQFLEDAKEKLHSLFNLLASKTKSLIAVNTFPLPIHSEQGFALPADSLDREEQTHALNQYIKQYVRDHSGQFVLINWERFARVLGREESIDFRYWYSYKAPFKRKFLNLYAAEIAKVIRALKGKAKKCLVLDCDNTLWGGILGEDGINEIKLEPNDYPGKVFYDFQQTVLHLLNRGVLLTLCSKNNEQDVWEILDKHPHCLIKRSMLAGWRINWENKAKNIAALAKELNLGLDSFVFVEDDPTECELVKNLIPEVTVLQVPSKLYEYPSLILNDGLFDTLNTSAEDKQRTAMYQAEAKRNNVKSRFENIDDFLASLELVATIQPIQPHQISRTAQLTQKTNQFNLTTRRYSESDIKQFINDPSAEIFTLSVHDKFGDSGLTGILIAKHADKKATVDSLLLSCRILGRKLEFAFVHHCLSQLEKKWAVERWEAHFIPTKKNQQAAAFWDHIGFKATQATEGHKTYAMEQKQRCCQSFKFISIKNH